MRSARIDVLIVTALKDELDAVLNLKVDDSGRDAWRQLRDNDDFPYHVREFRNVFGETLRVAAAWTGEMGETSAALRSSRLIEELDPACLSMCGICAGWKGKIFLGDVIVASRTFSYDHGKLVAARAGKNESELFHDIETYNLNKSWKVDAKYLADDFPKKWSPAFPRPISKEAQRRWVLFAVHAYEQGSGTSPDKHPERKTQCPGWTECILELRNDGLLVLDVAAHTLRLTDKGREWVAEATLLDPDGEIGDPPFRVHVAPIATGKTVRKDPELFPWLEGHVRTVLGAEMEAAAINFVAEQLKRKSIIAKAVSDYGDHEKDDTFRQFACHASASFIMEFLRRHLRAQEPGIRSPPKEQPQRSTEVGGHTTKTFEFLRKDRRDDFLTRVERACRLREPPGTQLVRLNGPPPFSTFLEVSVPDGPFARIYPLAALDQPITREAIEAFFSNIIIEYRLDNPAVTARLIHAGHAASTELARLAHGKRIDLQSFAQYQGLLDFSEYLRRQTIRLESDPVYPPTYYVEQRGQTSVGGQDFSDTEDVLQTIREMLDTSDRRFALVLGDFGAGKTFLLHELARRMGQEKDGALVPVLIELRALQKQRTLRELVAQHFAPGDVDRFDVDRFLYMLREGRVALLFDGFDELALRVTYDQALEHFGTLIEAAEGKAKVVVTSRTQHFLTDLDVKRELARRAEALPGYRLIKLERFQEEQIYRFLVKRLGSTVAADERMELLHDVRDLLGLSENPRLLSFIVELDADKLRSAREGSGEITSAKLYELLIDRWLKGEHERVNPPGAPKGLSLGQLRHGATALALLLWERVERAVGVNDLPGELFDAVNAQGEYALETDKIRHQLGSGSLLVRDEDGRFSFVHQSVMEWLVAEATAEQVRKAGDAISLSQRDMSDLMVDFFIALAGQKTARAWAERKSASTNNEMVKRNALHILGRLRNQNGGHKDAPISEISKNLEGLDLRDQDLSKTDLRNANLRKTNLSDVPMLEADLTGALLQQASLRRTNLDRAKLQDADLSDADLTGASMLGADLRGAKLQNTKLRRAKLLGAYIDSTKGCDVFGAALPNMAAPTPQFTASSGISAAAFSPTDTILATGHNDGTVRIWDVTNGMPLRVLDGQSSGVSSIAFSPDGTILASTSDSTVQLWNLNDGQRLHDLDGHEAYISKLIFDPTGETIATASADSSVRLWRIRDGKNTSTIKTSEHTILSIAFSPDGSLIASASEDATICIWRTTDCVAMHAFKGLAGPATSISFSPNGTTFAAACDDQTLRLWSVPEWKELWSHPSNQSTIHDIAFNPSGTLLATAFDDKSVGIWDMNQMKQASVLKGHDAAVLGVTFSLDGALIASFSQDGDLRLWNMPGGHVLRMLEGDDGYLDLRIAFDLEGKTLVSTSNAGDLERWDIIHGQHSKVSIRLPDDLDKICLSPNGTRLATLDYIETIKIWDTNDGRLTRVLKNTALNGINGLIFHPDNETLVTFDSGGSLTFWNTETGQCLRVLEGPEGAVQDVAFGPNAQTLAWLARGHGIVLWDLKTEKISHLISKVPKSTWSIAFSSDGKHLATVSKSRRIQLWSVDDGQLAKTIGTAKAPIRRLVFSNQIADILASISVDGRVELWNVTQGQSLCTLIGHRGEANDVAFDRAGTTIAAAYDDGVIGIHDIATGACLVKLLRLPDGWVALRHDGHYKLKGDTALAFWYAAGLCRFDPRELSSLLSDPLVIGDNEPLLHSRTLGH